MAGRFGDLCGRGKIIRAKKWNYGVVDPGENRGPRRATRGSRWTAGNDWNLTANAHAWRRKFAAVVPKLEGRGDHPESRGFCMAT